MLRNGILAFVLVVVVVGFGYFTPSQLSAQDGALVALSGVISSEREGEMEGVVVSARRDGSNFTVSVVSDNTGTYSFPRTHLDPGSYVITTRAVGYDLTDIDSITVISGHPTTVDLQLQEASDLSAQLSSREWAMSMPGTKAEKDKLVHQLLSCAYCHTYQRIMKSRHDADGFMRAIDRMVRYYADGTAVSNNNRRGRAGRIQEEGRVASLEQNPIWGVVPGIPRTELAEYLATVNLSGGKTTWDYELKTLQRPMGKATRVIITEYDMPTASTASHDSAIDSQGNVWYTDESAQLLGKFDTKTATFTEYAMPPVPDGTIEGTRDIIVDHEDNIWFPMRVESGHSPLTKFDPETEELTVVDEALGQFIALGPDGKVWAGWKRINSETMEIDGEFSYEGSPNLPDDIGGGYHNVIDSRGNPYIATYRGPGGIIGIDVETNAVEWHPVSGMKGRRGKIDSQDRYWFAEYLSDHVSMFNTRTKVIQRWPVPEYSTPYTTSTPDKNGYIYAPSNMAERFMRLDPRTGEIVDYQWPTEFDTKKISHDPTTDRVVLWMTNMRTARIAKVEPLD